MRGMWGKGCGVVMLRRIVAAKGSRVVQTLRGTVPAHLSKPAWLLLYGTAVGAMAAAALRLSEPRHAWPSTAADFGIVLLAAVAAVVFAARALAPVRLPRRRGIALVAASLLAPAAILIVVFQLLLSASVVQPLLMLLALALLVATWKLTPVPQASAAAPTAAVPTAPMAVLDPLTDADETNPEAMLRGLAERLAACAGFDRVYLYTPSDDRRALVLRAATPTAGTGSDAPPARTRLMLDRFPELAQALASGRWQTFPPCETAGPLTSVGGGCDRVTTVVGPLDGSDPSRGLVAALAQPTDAEREVAHRAAALRVELARRRPLIAAALATDLVSQIELPFGRLLRDLPSPLLLLNRYTRIIVVNAAAEQMLGRTAADLVGHRLCAGSHACECVVHRALHGKGPVRATLNLLFAGLRGAPAEGTATVWAIASAEDSQLIAIGLPSGAQESSDAAAGDLSGFDLTAVVAHDLRSPLSALRMASKLAGEEDLSSQDRLQLIASIERLVDRTDRIATDLLDAYRASAEQMDMLAEVINLRRCCAELVDELGVTAVDGPRIELRIDPALTVTAERAKLRAVLRNLLTNAIKHTSPGVRIEVSACYRHGETQITVRDGGPGVAAEEAPFLFDRFFRGGTAATRPEGHGLGLFIARRFVLLMGGRIWIEPDDGRGAAFSFTIPERRGAAPAPPAAAPQAAASH